MRDHTDPVKLSADLHESQKKCLHIASDATGASSSVKSMLGSNQAGQRRAMMTATSIPAALAKVNHCHERSKKLPAKFQAGR